MAVRLDVSRSFLDRGDAPVFFGFGSMLGCWLNLGEDVWQICNRIGLCMFAYECICLSVYSNAISSMRMCTGIYMYTYNCNAYICVHIYIYTYTHRESVDVYVFMHTYTCLGVWMWVFLWLLLRLRQLY